MFDAWNTFQKWAHWFNVDSFIFNIISISLDYDVMIWRIHKALLIKYFYNQKSPKNVFLRSQNTLLHPNKQYLCRVYVHFKEEESLGNWTPKTL